MYLMEQDRRNAPPPKMMCDRLVYDSGVDRGFSPHQAQDGSGRLP